MFFCGGSSKVFISVFKICFLNTSCVFHSSYSSVCNFISHLILEKLDCASGMFFCAGASKICIPGPWECDGDADCPNRHDEPRGCQKPTTDTTTTGNSSIPLGQTSDGILSTPNYLIIVLFMIKYTNVKSTKFTTVKRIAKKSNNLIRVILSIGPNIHVCLRILLNVSILRK